MENWKILSQHDGWLHIMSPSMAINDREVFSTFQSRRLLRQDLNVLEELIRHEKLKGWFSWTLTSRPHIMRLFSKVGAKPYSIETFKDPSEDKIWFRKEV